MLGGLQPARTGSAYRSYWMRLYGCVAIERAPCAMAISMAASARRGLYTSRSAFQQALRDASLASWRAAFYPPIPELLVPAGAISGAADTNVSSPYGCMSV